MLLVLTGGVVAAAVHKLFDVPLPIILGVFSGAVTNTPALGAGQQILTDLGSDPALVDGMGMGYAMAYPFGICGILLVMWLIRLFFRINIEREAQAFESSLAISVSCCTPSTWRCATPICRAWRSSRCRCSMVKRSSVRASNAGSC